MPVLQWIVRYMIVPTCRSNDDAAFFRCFLLLAEICAEMWLLKYRDFDAHAKAAATSLLPKMGSYIQSCKALFGMDFIKPKHHFMLHVPMQYLSSGSLFDTFPNERKHRLLKQKMTEQRGPLGNPAVLYNANCVQLREMKSQKSFFKSFFVSRTVVQGPYGKISLQKPLWFPASNRAGIVESFQDSDGGLTAIVRLASLTSTGVDAPGILAFQVCDARQKVALDEGGFLHVQYWLLQDEHLFLLY